MDVDSTRTRWFEKGTSENLVLSHGGVFGSSEAADGSLDRGLNSDARAQWFQVSALDLLGQGLTNHPASDADSTRRAATPWAFSIPRPWARCISWAAPAWRPA